jgi:hypothetical protein
LFSSGAATHPHLNSEVANGNGTGGNDSNGYLQGETNSMYNTIVATDVEFNKTRPEEPQGKLTGKFFSMRPHSAPPCPSA